MMEGPDRTNSAAGGWMPVLVTAALVAALACTSSSTASPGGDEDKEAPHVLVHEWGVVTYGTDYEPELLSIPDMPMIVGGTDDEEIVVRAPVVYFYGPEFEGDFTVETNGGRIIDTYPVADHLSSDMTIAEWRGMVSDYAISRSLSDVRDAGSYEENGTGAFIWPMGSWREVQSSVVHCGDPEIEERFVYYEVALDGLPPSIPLVHDRGGSPMLLGDFDGQLLLFHLLPDGSTATCLFADPEEAAEPMEHWALGPVDEDALLEVLYRWADGEMELEEIDALWSTWSGWLVSGMDYGRAGGSALILYRLPPDAVEDICSLHLDTEQGYPVDYSRFILAAMEVPVAAPLTVHSGGAEEPETR